MIRRIQISLRPSDALVALVALHGPAADGPAPPGTSAATYSFGLRAGQEIARAFEAHARSLDVFGQCLDWLERRGIATVERARSRTAPRALTWQRTIELRVDVKALTRDVTVEAGDADSPARASAWAVRAVLRHLATTTLHTCDVRAGTEKTPVAEALGSYDVALAAVGFGPNAAPPARLAHLASRVKRRDEAVNELPVEAPPAVKPAPAAKAAPASKAAPVARPTPAAKVKPAPKARVDEKPRATAPPRRPSVGFGGLPDDALPEDRRTGDVYGARGLTLDAEFFLTEAAIVEWPCDVKALERGRRLVVSKLHPDRAGDEATTSFHRAIKGHAELIKKLAPTSSAAPTSATPVVVDEKPAPAPATVSAVVEKPAVIPAPKRPRAKPTATATVNPPPPAPVASGSTYEWPPRPVEQPAPAPAQVRKPRNKARAEKADDAPARARRIA
jgi:outer membrane biosynthesis protein TonB